MKHILFFLFMATLLFTSCKNEKQSIPGDEKSENTGPEYSSAFVCPMHCQGSGSDKPGQCPVCEMDYVENKESNHPEESHDHNHEGLDHKHEEHDHENTSDEHKH